MYSLLFFQKEDTKWILVTLLTSFSIQLKNVIHIKRLVIESLDYKFQVFVGGLGWFWMVVTGFRWLWVALNGWDLFWVILGHFGSFWLVLAGFGCLCVVVACFGWFTIEKSVKITKYFYISFVLYLLTQSF